MSHGLRPKVLILAGYYIPGVRAGGPIKTLSNLVTLLGRDFSFSIITRGYDLGSIELYTSVEIGRWVKGGGAQIYYLRTTSFFRLLRLLRESDADVLYLNSFFSLAFSIFPLVLMRLGLIARARIVLAPRGEFGVSALGLKAWKKNAYFWAARALGLYRRVEWHASSEAERDDISNAAARLGFSEKPQISVASNLVKISEVDDIDVRNATGHLRVCFIARIVPIKNLDFVLRVLACATVPITFDIYGFKEDAEYWEKCAQLISVLPSHVKATFLGGVDNDEVQRVISLYHLLFVPSKGENFGHIFFEALSAGVPILVSDRTPWRDLYAQGVGWDIPLTEFQRYVDVINSAAKSPETLLNTRARCLAYARAFVHGQLALAANRRLFNNVEFAND